MIGMGLYCNWVSIWVDMAVDDHNMFDMAAADVIWMQVWHVEYGWMRIIYENVDIILDVDIHHHPDV